MAADRAKRTGTLDGSVLTGRANAASRCVRLTMIVPATDQPPTLSRCLKAIRGAEEPPEQVIVVEDPTIRHPAVARNQGARDAGGDVLVFVDADVLVHSDVFVRVRDAFEADPDLAALFGSYDDRPGSRGVVAAFRNLLHHHVHQCAGGPAGTFWAGLGAMRRTAFEESGGFVEHPIEDIELGMRLASQGARIVLDPKIQGTHLKSWKLLGMIRTDLLVRGVPWIGLLLKNRDSASTSALNLGWRHRLSALASVLLVLAIFLLNPWLALGAGISLVVLNRSFYALLIHRQGILRGTIGVALHVVHLLTAVLAVPIGILVHLTRRSNPEKTGEQS